MVSGNLADCSKQVAVRGQKLCCHRLAIPGKRTTPHPPTNHGLVGALFSKTWEHENMKRPLTKNYNVLVTAGLPVGIGADSPAYRKALSFAVRPAVHCILHQPMHDR